MKTKKQEILFIVIGILLLLITVGFIIYSVNFLLANIKDALNQDLARAKGIVRFNFEGLKKLGIIK